MLFKCSVDGSDNGINGIGSDSNGSGSTCPKKVHYFKCR